MTAGPYGLQAARRATTAIPIVMISCDPAETIVERIARPSGHITGVTCMSADLTPKRLQLLKETVPSIQPRGRALQPLRPEQSRGSAADAGSVPNARDHPSARRGGEPGAFERAVADAIREGADALFVLPDPLTLLDRRRIADLAAKHRLPAMYGFKEFVMAGGLMSYGTMQTDLYRRAAAHVDKVLRGTNPADVPVEQATHFELVINLKTAKVLGLTIPQTLLLRADQVIE